MADDGVLREFLTRLGFEVDESAERRFDTAITKATLQAKLLGDALEAMARKLVDSVASTARSMEQLYYHSQRTRSSAANFQAFGFAAAQMGSSVEDANTSMESFARNLRENPGKWGMLRSLGVTATDTTDAMLQFGEIAAKMPYYQAKLFANQFGIDERTLMALENSKEFRKRMASEQRKNNVLGLDMGQASKDARDFMNSLRDLGDTIDKIGQKFLGDFFHDFGGDLKRLNDYLLQHGQEIARTLDRIAGAILKVVDALVHWLASPETQKSLNDFATWLSNANADGTFDKWQKAAEAFAAFIAGAWLVRVIGALSRVNIMLGIIAAAWALMPNDKQVEKNVLNGHDQDLGGGDNTAGDDWFGGAWGKAKQWWKGKGLPIWNRSSASIERQGAVHQMTSAKQREMAEESFKFWKSKGLSDAQAAGLVANEQAESKFDPRAIGDGGDAHGLFQWHADRRAAIARGAGINVDTANHAQQLEAAYWEMTKGGERGAWNTLKAAKTPTEAATALVYNYERPADKRGQSISRSRSAEYWAKTLPSVIDKNTPHTAAIAPLANALSKTADAVHTAAQAQREGVTKSPFGALPSHVGTSNMPVNSPLLNTWQTSHKNIDASQTNHVTIYGSGEPQDAALSYGRFHKRVQADLVRNLENSTQ